MDAGSLRLALAKIRGRFDDEQLRDAADALEDRLQNAQQWLHTTDPQTLAGLGASLGQVNLTIYAALERVRRSQANGDEPEAQHSPLLASSERATSTQCSIDLEECVLLSEFALNILLLPTGSQAQNEANDLSFAARVLYDAQQRLGNERLELLRGQQSLGGRCTAFDTFIAKVLEAESAVWDQHCSNPRRTHDESTGAACRDPAGPPSRPQNDRFDDSGAQSPGIPTPSRQTSQPWTTHEIAIAEKCPPKTPKEMTTGADSIPRTAPQQRIARRPVARTSTTPVEPAPSSSLSHQGPSRSGNYQEARRVSTRLSSRRGRRTGTRELFTQASRSLGNLTLDFDYDNPSNDRDLPPPYVEHAAEHIKPENAKRPHANSVCSKTSQNASTFALVQDNLLDLLRERVKHGGSINEVDPLTRRTVLMEAAHLERTNMVGMMLTVSSQLHQKDVEGNSALHYAASQGNAAICKALLETGANVEDYNRNGETPISLAARGGHTDAVDGLLNFWTVQRGTAAALTKGYLEALKSGNVSTVAAFIERNIKPKKVKESVICAAEGGSVPVLEYILTQKASLKERNPDGWTALHFAAEKGHVAMVEKLLSLGLSWKTQTRKIGETSLAIAVRKGQVAAANALILAKGAQVNRCDRDRVSPLHHAIRLGDLSLTTTLLNAGAKLDAQSKYGWNPMHTAVAYGHTHLVAELITRGVSIEEKLDDVELNSAEKTNEGARRGYWAEIRWPHSGTRPLHLSLEFGHDEVANLLLAAGAKIDVPDGKGWRPLHYASFSARPVIVDLLLNKGASPHATTDDNTTPLGLGFREYGLSASEDDKIRVWELLQGAMNATKKSKRKQFADFMSGSKAGRQVEKRNRIWHTAELAASLHLQEDPPDGSSEQQSELTMSTHENALDETSGQETGRIASGASFAQDVKS